MIYQASRAEQIFAELRALTTGANPITAVQEYCRTNLSHVEALHFDYKRKSDPRSGESMNDSDRRNLAKAVSGFANSTGGVLIWGLEDKTLDLHPIENSARFTASLLSLASQCTDPPVQGLDGFVVHSQSGPGLSVILVPESPVPPHRVTLSDPSIRDHYFYRTSDSFLVATHGMLAYLFGKRAQPELGLVHQFRGPTMVKAKVAISITNSGRGHAVAPFLRIRITSGELAEFGIDGNRNFGLEPVRGAMGPGEYAFGGTMDRVIHAGGRLDVAALQVLRRDRSIGTPENPPKYDPLIFDYELASIGFPLIRGTYEVPADEVDRDGGPRR